LVEKKSETIIGCPTSGIASGSSSEGGRRKRGPRLQTQKPEISSAPGGKKTSKRFADSSVGRSYVKKDDIKDAPPSSVSSEKEEGRDVHVPSIKRQVSDCAGWLNLLQIPVSAGDLAAQEFATDNNLPVRIDPRKTVNPHGVSALARDIAVKMALAKFSVGKNHLTVLDVFGSPRTLKFNPATSPFVVPHKHLGSSSKMSIEIFSAPDVAFRGDASRSVEAKRSLYPCEKVDVAIMVDIYQSGSSWKQQLDPEFVHSIIDRTHSGKVVWIGRPFVGLAGADDEYAGKIEQVFVKRDGFVYSTPDRTNNCYPAHPSPDWLFQRSFGGLSISVNDTIGPYRIITLAKEPVSALPVGPVILPRSDFVEVEIDRMVRSSFFSFGIRRSQMVKVYMPLVLENNLKFSVKISHGCTLDTVIGLVQRTFTTDVKLCALRDRFPTEWSVFLQGTALAILYWKRKNTVEGVLNLRATHSESERGLVSARGSGFSLFRTYHWKTIAFGFVLGCVVFSNRRVLIPLLSKSVVAIPVHLSSWCLSEGNHLVEWLKAFSTILCTTSLSSVASWFGLPSQNAIAVPGAVFRKHPIASALAEEVITNLLPGSGLVMAVYEMWRDLKESKGENLPFLACLHGALGFGRSFGLPWKVFTCFAHLWWNWKFSRDDSDRAFDNFRILYADGKLKVAQQQVWKSLPLDLSLPSLTSSAPVGPENFRGKLKLLVDGVDCTLEEALEKLGNPPGLNRTFPILITNRLLFQPSNTDKNLLVAIAHRLHNDPFVGGVDEKIRHENWRILGGIVREYLPSVRTFRVKKSENIELMGKKGGRLKKAMDEELAGYFSFGGKTINLKYNETIAANKSIGGVETLKPRAIQNLPALTHAIMGGQARSFSKELHNVFDGKVHFIFGFPVRVFFASGYNQEQLSEIGKAMDSGDIVFTMSGDDSATSWGSINKQKFGEADQSKFDHTQDDGPMKHYMGALLKHMGFSSEFALMALSCCQSGFSFRKGRLIGRGFAGTQMPTGITTTTTFNSMSTFALFVWTLKIVSEGKPCDPTYAGRQLGFDVKYKEFDTLDQITFLKGWWLDGPRGIQWVPLPSAVLKLGKVLRSPVEITRVKIKGQKVVELSLQDAVRACAFALASSYGQIDFSYPILGSFVAKLQKLSLKNELSLSLQESWKPTMTGVSVFRDGAVNAICQRYGITSTDIEEVENLIALVDSLPAYVEHSVFDALAEADY